MPYRSRLLALAGAALLLPAAAHALPSTIPAWTHAGIQDSEQLGTTVANAGDLNGDGFDDVAAGAPMYDGVDQDSGRVHIWLGSALGLPASATWTLEGAVEDAHFGIGLASAGDVNGDGYDDLLIGADEHDAGAGPVGGAFLYTGSASGLSATPAWSALGEESNDRFGHSVAGVGDIDNDGFDDIVIGAFRVTEAQVRQGRVYLYRGSSTGLESTPSWVHTGIEAGENMGATVAGAGDINDDGFDDVLVAAPGYSDWQANEGRVRLFLGSAAGLPAEPDWMEESNWWSASMGFSMAGVGDVDGDGYDDVVIGCAPEDITELEGDRIWLFKGGAGGLGTTPDWTAIDAPYPHSHIAVAPAGDVNGDGLADVLIGREVLYLDHHGDAWLFLGSAATGLEATEAWHWTPTDAETLFGSAVAGADVDGDGLSDLVIGARAYNNDELNQGRVGVYLGDGTTGPGGDDDDATGDDDDATGDDDDATGDDDDASDDDDAGDDDSTDEYNPELWGDGGGEGVDDKFGCDVAADGSASWLGLLLLGGLVGVRRSR